MYPDAPFTASTTQCQRVGMSQVGEHGERVLGGQQQGRPGRQGRTGDRTVRWGDRGHRWGCKGAINTPIGADMSLGLSTTSEIIRFWVYTPNNGYFM